MIAWPFGNYKDGCSTYSKCWFGILTCGTPKSKHMQKIFDTKVKHIVDAMLLDGRTHPFPEFTGWSIKALNVAARVIGPEIVVPEQRYLRISDSTSRIDDEVIIAQYHLTKLPLMSSFHLELDLYELYPGMFYNWSQEAKDEFNADNYGFIYLGASEYRVLGLREPDMIKYGVENMCCGCNRMSAVGASPYPMTVTDGSHRCPDLHKRPLPICPSGTSTLPGRWISAESQCEAARTAEHAKHAEHAEDAGLPLNVTTSGWFEASGDPCVIDSDRQPEDLGKTYWFYAPYKCKYHFYTKSEANACFAKKHIHHIMFNGDSMTRELFGAFGAYVGNFYKTDKELKQFLNIDEYRRYAIYQPNFNERLFTLFSSKKVLISMGKDVCI
jgi:hypothetical protein